MIIIYPMLTSPSVSPNVLPGLIKSVEKYILVYKADDILKYAAAGNVLKTGATPWINYAITSIGVAAVGAAATYVGKKVQDYLNNNIQIAMDKESLLVLEEDKKGGNKRDDAPRKSPLLGDDHTIMDAKPDLQVLKDTGISLEPTWFKVSAPGMGTRIVGVKVVPFVVKSPENIISLMSRDAILKRFDALLQRYSRALSRVLLRLNPFRGSVSDKNYKNTIVYGGSSYGKNLFICFSQLDLQSENQFSDADTVRKLHKLGWASFVIANDVNRSATFCMKEFGGVCSTIPYSYMFASLGKDQTQAYNDLEDLKRKSGPFFRMSTNRKRIFASESSTPTIVDKYLELLSKENE